MARKKEPVAVIEAKGNKSKLSAEEKARRRAEEVNVPEVAYEPHESLNAAQLREFAKISDYLTAVNRQNERRGGGNIYSGMDSESIAQYIVCKDLAHHYQVRLQNAIKASERAMREGESVLEHLAVQKLASAQHRYYCEQSRKYAADLGLTVSSRMKIVLPGKPDEGGEFGGF